MLVQRKTMMSGLLTSNVDSVCAWAPLPPGAKVLGVQGEVHILGPEDFPTRQFTGWGMSGYVEPLVDPDGSITLDTFWDNMVTKPTVPTVLAATNTVDLDFDSTDTGPDVEVGEIDITRMTTDLAPGKVLMEPHLEMLSFAKNRQGGWHAETGETDQWQPTDFKTFRVRRTLLGDEKMPAYAMLGLSAPVFDREEVSHTVVIGSREWAQLGNLRNIMQDFWKINVGMAETGAESPYAEASSTIEDLVAPEIVMPSTATVVTIPSPGFTWLCWATWDLDYPDSSVPGLLAAHAA